MGKDYVAPVTPPTQETNNESPPVPVPVRRTLGFWNIPEAERADANLRESIQQGVSEANRLYRELAVEPVAQRPEVARAEDDSFTTERFGAEDGAEQNGVPIHPQFMPTNTNIAVRPRMRRR